MQSDRIVPKKPKGNDAHVAAAALGMNLDRVVHAEPGRQVPEERIYTTEDGGTTLHHVLDPQSGLSWLVLKGKDVAGNEVRLRERIGTYTLDEIEAELKDAKGKDRVLAIYRLGIAAPARLDRRVFDLLVEAMHDGERKVRQAAVWATAYSAWPQFRKPLEEVRDADGNPEIRDDAGNILKAMDAER